ncbi:hypothetical protein ACIHAA_22905 [Streptomyces sp. NPDC052040]|uniref:hypothetical protein n=1 Tax=unclassified Streptomyces TaxID=2593676 RepID=UPI0037D89865
MTAGWCARTVRAAVFAAVCVLLAALGHVLMSGTDVPAWALAAGVATTGAAGWCLAGRERGLPLIVTVVVAAQGLLHEAFSYAQSARPTSAPPSHPMPMPMHMHMDMSPMSGMNGLAQTSHPMNGSLPYHHPMDGGSSFGMFAAHLLAALLCGLWLAHGEKAAFRILRAVAGWLAAPLRPLFALPVTPDRPRVRPRRRRSERAPRLLLLVHAITSRGPPVGTAVI